MTVHRDAVRIVIALVVGVVLFSIDLLLEVISGIVAGAIAFIAILFVVGIVSGGVKNGLVSALLTLLAMIPVGILLWPFIPHLPATGDLASMALLLMVAIMCKANWDELEGEPLGVCCVLLVLISLMVVFAPWFYFSGFLIGGLGGFVGRAVWPSVEKPKPKSPGADAGTGAVAGGTPNA